MSIEIIAKYDHFQFLPAGFFSYDASEEIINYDPDRLPSRAGKIALLHEISHCELGHFHYKYDLELLMLEVAAWNHTKKLAKQHGVDIAHQYIQDCIASYDEWVTKRGTCPGCDNFCIEQDENVFRCFVCNTRWRVSNEPQKRITRTLLPQN